MFVSDGSSLRTFLLSRFPPWPMNVIGHRAVRCLSESVSRGRESGATGPEPRSPKVRRGQLLLAWRPAFIRPLNPASRHAISGREREEIRVIEISVQVTCSWLRFWIFLIAP